MKRITLFMFAMLCAVAVSVAQERGDRQGQGQNRNPEEMVKNRVERLSKELSLTAVQQDSISNYLLGQAKSLAAARGSGQQEGRENFRAVMEKQNTKIKSFLNKDQVKKFEELQVEQQRRRPQQ